MVETVTPVFVVSSFWNRKVSRGLYSSDRTHVKDLKNLVEIRLPRGDRLFILLRVEMPGNCVPFTPLDQLHLNTCHSPAIEGISMDGSRCMWLV